MRQKVMDSINENDIIERIIGGDTEAFSYIVDKYKDMVFNIVHKIIPDCQDAEDITQDVFIKVFQKLDSFKSKSKLTTWIYTIAYNEAITATRKKTHDFIAIPDNFDIKDDDTSEEVTYSDELLELLKKEMENLDPLDNLILTLYYNMENSIEEIAEITGLTQANVKVKLFRTRKKLLYKLKDKTH